MNQIFSAAPPGAAKMKQNILASKTNLGARPRKRSVIMKKMKKLFAILMTMAMVMGLSITGFAAENTNVKVKVSNVDGADLYYDQIVKADASSTDGWAYTDDYKRFFGNVSIGDLVRIAEGTQNGDASTGELTESSKLAAVLDDLRSTVQVEKNKVSGNTFTATSGGLLLMLLWAVMISLCHADMRSPRYLSWNGSFDGADIRPITEELNSYIPALPTP